MNASGNGIASGDGVPASRGFHGRAARWSVLLVAGALGVILAGGLFVPPRIASAQGETPDLGAPIDFGFAESAAAREQYERDRIQPYAQNPRYFQYLGEPLILLGGGPQDKLFQHERLLSFRAEPWRSASPDTLEEHLDLVASVGGNYVRNTMSHRREPDADPYDESVFPYLRDDEGRFDLRRWNDEYWTRLERLLALAEERGIIVQIEIWAPFDYHDTGYEQAGWARHPFNPANNVNYSAAASGLPTEWSGSPGDASSRDHPFTTTVPALDDNALVLAFQQRFVRKILSVALRYPNVLYLVANEPNSRLEWDAYWAEFVQREAAGFGRGVEVGDMRREQNLRSDEYEWVLSRPEIFRFVDISQNHAGSMDGDLHWERIVWAREYTSDAPRPLTNVKIYGGELSWTQGPQGAMERFWRNILAGSASARFHRDPGGGIGITPPAQRHIRSMRMVLEEVDVMTTRPALDLLRDRESNEAYAAAEPGRHYIVYMPAGGDVGLDLDGREGTYELRWLDIDNVAWTVRRDVEGGGVVRLEAPGNGHWVAVLVRTDDGA